MIMMASNNQMHNYLREIRGISGVVMTSDSSSSSSLVCSGIKSTLDASSSSNSNPLAESYGQQPKALNRQSRVVLHPQLHQQHLKNVWKHYLYELQQRAPTPKRVVCPFVIRSRPSHYGREFHGIMSRDEAEQILLDDGKQATTDQTSHHHQDDGRYLIRESSRQKSQMTLSLRFNNQTKNFRLFYDHQGGQHYVNELKRFDTVHDLVADGLITLYVELHAADYIANLANQSRYEESPYMTLHKNRLLKTNKQTRSACKLDNVQIMPIQPQELCLQDDPCDDDDSLDRKFDVRLYEKAHNFRTHTFIGHPWCDFCGNFIWGLIGQGVRCEDCGFGAHRKCSESVPNDCCPDLRHIRRIFGIDLTTFCKASQLPRPFIVELCVAEIERRGLRVEGLYRACGSSDEIDLWKNRFETDWEHTPLAQIEDIHVVTGLLKQYLRLLPIPLITFDSYQRFVDSAKKSCQEQAVQGLRDASHHLPPAHYQTLKFLIVHLNKVCAYEDYNLMSAKNLGLIFGQTLIYTPNIPMMFQMMNCCWEYESKAIELMILFHDKIFK
nr:N-chimaerin-like [Dermatophagoides farinae]